MSATVRIRVDLADAPTLKQASWRPPYLLVERFMRVEDTLEYVGTTVRLAAESLEALHDWLETAAAQVHAAIPGYGPDAPDTDAAAADAGSAGMSGCAHQWSVGVIRDGRCTRWCGHCGTQKGKR